MNACARHRPLSAPTPPHGRARALRPLFDLGRHRATDPATTLHIRSRGRSSGHFVQPRSRRPTMRCRHGHRCGRRTSSRASDLPLCHSTCRACSARVVWRALQGNLWLRRITIQAKHNDGASWLRHVTVPMLLLPRPASSGGAAGGSASDVQMRRARPAAGCRKATRNHRNLLQHYPTPNVLAHKARLREIDTIHFEGFAVVLQTTRLPEREQGTLCPTDYCAATSLRP